MLHGYGARSTLMASRPSFVGSFGEGPTAAAGERGMDHR
jgi:hypothetical protein